MSHVESVGKSLSFGGANSNGFTILIAFDSASAQFDAEQTAQYVEAQLARDFQVRRSLWSIDLLKVARLGELASKDAMIADMIIVCCTAGSEQSTILKTWMSTWMPARNGGGALVAVIKGEDANASAELHQFLQAAANSAEMDLIAKRSTKSAA